MNEDKTKLIDEFHSCAGKFDKDEFPSDTIKEAVDQMVKELELDR